MSRYSQGIGRAHPRVKAAPGIPAGLILPPKPVKSIGRDKARCYCQTCGLKKRACVCDERNAG